MVIDDDPLSLTLISILLEGEGFRVTQERSGEDALLALDQLYQLDVAYRPQVLLVDLQMPGLSGVKLAMALRERVGGNVLLLAMSATEGMIPTGYDGFLLKPLDIEQLKTALAGEIAENVRAAEDGQLSIGSAEKFPAIDESIYGKLLAIMTESAVKEIYDACLHDTRTRVEKMRQAGSRGDLQAVRAAAHAIKGGSGMIGASCLMHLSAALEQGGYESHDLPPLLDELLVACEKVERILLTR